VVRQVAVNGIDPECEQLIKFGIERRFLERPGAYHVPVKRFQVAKIKNETMPFPDGARVQSARRKHLIQPVRLRSRGNQFLTKHLPQVVAVHDISYIRNPSCLPSAASQTAGGIDGLCHRNISPPSFLQLEYRN